MADSLTVERAALLQPVAVVRLVDDVHGDHDEHSARYDDHPILAYKLPDILPYLQFTSPRQNIFVS